MKEMNKLVRDKIPDIIQESGRSCSYRILKENEYLGALETKLSEEVAEYQKDKNIEEMADILEVLQALCIAKGYTLKELEKVKEKKAKERGSFAKRIFLEHTD